jgi:hypothetical protein
LKKTIFGQKAKSIKNHESGFFVAPNENLDTKECNFGENKQYTVSDHLLLADVRKRAHSVGSKTW